MSEWGDAHRRDDLIRALRSIEDAGRGAAVALTELRVVTDRITEHYRDEEEDD